MNIQSIYVELDREGTEGMMPDYRGEQLAKTVKNYCETYEDQIRRLYPLAAIDVSAYQSRTYSTVEVNRYEFRIPVNGEDVEDADRELANVAEVVERIGYKMLDLADQWDTVR
ncbi:MAG: hypothetical protein WC683_19950 [bacterium]